MKKMSDEIKAKQMSRAHGLCLSMKCFSAFNIVGRSPFKGLLLGIFTLLNVIDLTVSRAAIASQSGEKIDSHAKNRGVGLGEPQLRLLNWKEVARGSRGPVLESLFDMKHLSKFARPAHLSAQNAAYDLGGYLYNSESSIGIDPTFVRLKNRSDLQLLSEMPMRAYFGLLHAHTFASDGMGTARSAFRTARDIAKLDFFAVTDHSEYWLNGKDPVWREQGQTAFEESRPEFIGLTGFEYSNTLQGHVVVLNSSNWINAIQAPTWTGFLNWLALPEQRQTLAIFAHPGFHRYRNWFDLNHFGFDKRLKEQFVGVEFIHKNVWRRSMDGYSGNKSFLDEALLQGWHLGPVASQDNHSEFWGIADSNRIALIMENLSRDNILDALKKRRYYSTQSPQLQLAVGLYSSKGVFLGTLGQTIPAEQLQDGGGTLRVRILEPNPQFQICRFDVLLDGDRARHLTFLNTSSRSYFLENIKNHSKGDANCSPEKKSKPWWERLLNNGIVTGRAFEWIFDEQPLSSPEVLEISVPVEAVHCGKIRRSQKRSWNLVVRILQGVGGEKLTLTSPITVGCSGSSDET